MIVLFESYTCANNTAFPTTITLPITSLAYTLAWDCNGGVITSIKDPNGNTTSFDYTDPNFWRIKEIDYPDQGKTTINYTDAATGFWSPTVRLWSWEPRDLSFGCAASVGENKPRTSS